MSIIKKQDFINVAAILIIFGLFFGLMALIAPSLQKAFETDENRFQQEQSSKAYKIELGVSKDKFVSQIGKPDYVMVSKDGRYNCLEYKMLMPYSSNLVATVEKTSGKVIGIGHGEDWKEDRYLEGYSRKEIEWDYPTRSKFLG